jgi:hypothetical protein
MFCGFQSALVAAARFASAFAASALIASRLTDNE